MIDETGKVILGVLPLLICLVVAVGTPLLIVLLTRSSGRKRDELLAAQWEQALQQAASGHGNIAFVRWVYQRARSGTGAKAFIVWHGVSWDQDTWFDGRPRIPQGIWVLVRGSIGWGAHNRNPKRLWVDFDGVLAELPASAPAAHQRHRKRMAKRAQRAKTRS